MNKLYLWGIIITAVMFGFIYMSFDFKHGLSDIVNQLAVVGAVAIVLIVVFVTIKYVRQMQTESANGELAEESWDNIGEYKNPLPFGWAIMFLGTMVWGLWYWTLGYPVNAYSAIGEYNEDVAAHDKKFNAQYAGIKGDRLVEMGESVFLVECVACHGLDATGNNEVDAADLNQRLSFKTIKHVIEHGSNNQLLGSEMPMPDRNGLFNMATNALITDSEINAVSVYVAGGMDATDKVGAEVFANVCSSCHGVDGKGMEYVAPNIAEWSQPLIINVLNHGKVGVIGKMPEMDRLNAKQKEAVAAYIISLGKGE